MSGDLIQRLKLAMRGTTADGGSAFVKVADLQEAIAALEAFQWTPVSERLPKQWGEYFIAFDKGLVMECGYNSDEGEFIETWQGRYHRVPDVTHWMPLPAPPTCAHAWIDARNTVIESGEICLKCNSMRAGNPLSTHR
jgi:hypothetical protein